MSFLLNFYVVLPEVRHISISGLPDVTPPDHKCHVALPNGIISSKLKSEVDPTVR